MKTYKNAWRKNASEFCTTNSIQSFRKKLASFRSSTSGAFAPTAAIALSTLVLCTAVAVQYSDMSRDRSNIQDALDAAVLTGATTPGTMIEKRKAAKAHFLANIGNEKNFDALKMNFTDVNGEFTGKITIDPKDYFVPFLEKFDTLEVTSAAGMKSDIKIEVSIVLDFSDSMGVNGKMQEMKAAANAFIDKMELMQDITQVKVALTPFAALVGIDVPEDYIIDTPIYQDYDGDATNGRMLTCTGDRRYPYNVDGRAPNTGISESKFGDNAGGYYRNNPNACKTLFIDTNLIAQPLSKDMDKVRGALNAMQVSALTHLSLGMEIGWQMLNPDKPFEGAVAFNNPKTQKYLIFLTDGAQSAPAYGPGDLAGGGDVAQGWTNLSAICSGAKNKGVTVSTIAYDIAAGNASHWVTGNEEADLAACASKPTLAFAPGASTGELAKAFDDIHKQILNSVIRLLY